MTRSAAAREGGGRHQAADMHTPVRHAKGAQAFSLIETMIASVFVTVSALALYSCIAFGLKLISISREDRRATQILVETTETLRLYTWEQLHDSTFLTPNFRVQYDPMNTANPGVTYVGSVAVTNFVGSENYASNMALVTVALVWTNDNVPRRREHTTIVTQLGLQNYVY